MQDGVNFHQRHGQGDAPITPPDIPVPRAITPFSSTSQGYQLRLFLESFGIRSALLNAELPLNSRSHILQTFNKGLFDYLIATGARGGGEMGLGSHSLGR